MPTELLIIAHSGRALAASARRAGYSCVVIDAFNDIDTRACSRQAWLAGAGFTREALAPLLDVWRQSCPSGSQTVILPGSGFEADPEMLTWLRYYGEVAANPAAVVKQFKEPARFFTLLDTLAIRHPSISLQTPADDAVDGARKWLCKPIGGEGGSGIMPWPPDRDLPQRHYLQQWEEGETLSVVFLADGRRSRVMGFNHCRTVGEINGDQTDFRFAEIIQAQPCAELLTTTAVLLDKLTTATGLRGLCGMDLLHNAHDVSVLEINPRPPASFELHEQGDSLAAAHLLVCAGVMSQRTPAPWPGDVVIGKRVVYCDEPIQVPADFVWPDWTTDRPAGGIWLEADMPLCTVHGHAVALQSCRQLLQQRHEYLLNKIKNDFQVIKFNEFKHRKEMTA